MARMVCSADSMLWTCNIDVTKPVTLKHSC
nr:MAG TPA: hypothetical protein [Caudoviricetes sp.]